MTDRQTDRQHKYSYYYEKVTGTGKYSKFSEAPSIDEIALKQGSRGGTITSIENSEELANIVENDLYSLSAKTAMILGIYEKNWGKKKKKEIIPNKTDDKSIFSQVRYKFFLDAPFEISNKCCNVMKKTPVHKYAKESGRHPITAQMASESRLRTQKWLQNGCNGFNLKEPISNPMSFWTEQDVLLYIKENNLPICSVYGDIVEDISGTDEVEGQLSLEGFESTLPLKTTGCSRTGCMFCGFGCHLEKPGEGRFERMKETHPTQYAWIMKAWNKGGLGYKDVIDWINEHGNFDIRY